MEKTETEEEAGFFQKRWVHIGLIILITFGVYANSFRNEFVYDDKSYVISIPSSHIKNPKDVLQIFPRLFTKEYFALSGEFTYRPVATLSYFVYYALFGFNTLGYRILNTLLHLAVVLSLYFLCLRLFKNGTLSLFAAAFFAVHPVNTESILEVSFNEDMLACLFLLLSFYFHIRNNSPGQRNLFLCGFISAGLYLLALFSKETAVIGLVLFALYDYLTYGGFSFMARISKRAEYFFLAIFTLFYLLLRFIIFSNLGATTPYIGDSFYVNILTMTKVLVVYCLRLLIFPFNLRILYGIDPVTHFYEPIFLFSVIVLLVVALLASRLWRLSNKIFLFFLLWPFVTLVPVMNLIPFLKDSFVTEHYLYIPCVGFCILFSIVIGTVIKSNLSSLLNRHLKFVLWLIPLIILLLYAIMTIQRNLDWRDGFTLWSDAVVKSPKNWKVHANLGDEYQKRKEFDEAIEHYRKALEINPDYLECRYALANILLYTKGLHDEAILQYRRLLEIAPDHVGALRDLGIAYLFKGAYREAIEEFKKILVLQPDNKRALQGYEEALRLYHAFPDSEKNK